MTEKDSSGLAYLCVLGCNSCTDGHQVGLEIIDLDRAPHIGRLVSCVAYLKSPFKAFF